MQHDTLPHNLTLPHVPLAASSRFADHADIRRNLSVSSLINTTLKAHEGVLTDTGALAVTTGKFTGRSPEDRFIVRDAQTESTVDWGNVNHPLMPQQFDALYIKMRAFVARRTLFVQDVYAGAAIQFRQKVEIATTKAWQSLFVKNLFLAPSEEAVVDFDPDWAVLCVPEFEANPAIDGTRQGNFTIINFSRKLILIGGTEYAGEIKKSLFSVLNYILPLKHGVLPMHCSATIGAAAAGEKGDVALFFGLSGTGKTTLSADPNRRLIGDDEHGWGDNIIFNFEGGCYAKVIRLNAAQEPRIFGAIRYGTVLENVRFQPGLLTVNYDDDALTENTRAAYPLTYADPKAKPVVKAAPRHIFFLTADASGVLPPLAALTEQQAQAFFLAGYTSKVAGTEVGIVQPKPTFSACFGAAFLPLPAQHYADLLATKIRESGAKVWLVNTGWTGGGYGVGQRMPLFTTRTLINAVLTNTLDLSTWKAHPVFGIAVPKSCPGLSPRLFETKAGWADEEAYLHEAHRLLAALAKHLQLYVGPKGVQQLLEGADLKGLTLPGD